MERTRRRTVRGRKTTLGEQEKRRLAQLAVCLVIFLVVFLGRGIFPVQTESLRSNLLEIIRQDTDFRSVFSHLGRAVAEEAPVLETLDDVWVEMFGGEGRALPGPDRQTIAQIQSEIREETGILRPWTRAPLPQEPAAPPEPTPEPSPAERDLGLSDTMTPVVGILTSGFGVREHPIDGEIKMHEGVDLAADEGGDVLAFADGTVDYIGESPAYGQYLQLRHANGITTFYAHCSQLCVQKGQSVQKGQVVAKVGQTGNATGPHLHLEMKKDGEYIDPLPYVDYLTE